MVLADQARRCPTGDPGPRRHLICDHVFQVFLQKSRGNGRDWELRGHGLRDRLLRGVISIRVIYGNSVE